MDQICWSQLARASARKTHGNGKQEPRVSRGYCFSDKTEWFWKFPGQFKE